ncbi:MAG: quinoprotein dehydrogenase-associated SoxYZ-like carrier [Hyphomicrobiaceae bacterium]|nr:quinoprotein dehydrogenase-associated SoxYZ-like carrier [Hyphomicrobiaceae bacterium]
MMWARTAVLACVAAAICAMAPPARAGASWDALKPDVFGSRPILDGRGIVELSAPGRPLDQRAVPVSVSARMADGRTIKAVSIIVDENPSPVAAVFLLGPGRTSVSLSANLRFNAGTDVRAVVEASDGALYMVERHVKFAGGQAACSAPPEGDPLEIAANMGKMRLEHAGPRMVAASDPQPKVRLSLSHPNHTGMVLDQISLLYVPLRMVSEIAVRQGGELVFSMTGSIALSQNPAIGFDYRVNGEAALQVTSRDSDGAQWSATFPIGQGS